MGGTFSEYPEASIVTMGSGCYEEIWCSWSSDSFNAPTNTGTYKKNKTSVPYSGQTEALVFHIKQKLTANFTKTPSVCQSPITFTADTVTNNPNCLWDPVSYYKWDFGDGSTDTGKVVQHAYNYAGSYPVTLTIGCPDAVKTQTVTLTSAMTGTITANDKTCDNLGSASVVMAGGTLPYTYSWSNAGTTSSINNLDTGTYKVDVLDATNGCFFSASVIVVDSVIDCQDSIFIPNVFTPNNDSKNDKWIISQFKYKEIKVEIYDRWGLKMAGWNSLNGAWEGRTGSGKECPDGTYYYIINTVNSKDEKKEYTGFVQLLREGK